jgi:PAS domain S-box-containing protein
MDEFRVLFDVNPRPMFVSDRETLQILEVNRAACELYGWSRDEMLALTLRDIRPPEELAYFETAFADRKDLSRPYARLGRHCTKAGKHLHISLEITPITFRDRRASIVVITDVTGINEVERRFQLLVENSTDGISLTNPENGVQYVSPSGLRMLGYAPDDLATFVGQRAGMNVHPEDVPQWSAPAHGQTRRHVARVRHRDGTWRWIESSTTNLTHDPAVRAFVSNYRDVTERVVAETALRESQRTRKTFSATSPTRFVSRDFGSATFTPTTFRSSRPRSHACKRTAPRCCFNIDSAIATAPTGGFATPFASSSRAPGSLSKSSAT